MSKIIPENCNKCEHTKSCNSAYGGLGCRYEKEICAKAINAHNAEEDVVREPSHYKHGTFETIDEMLLVFGPQKTYDYCIVTAWKYRSRAPFKGKPEQDMEKANRYLEMAKEIAEANKGYVKPVTLIKENKEG